MTHLSLFPFTTYSLFLSYFLIRAAFSILFVSSQLTLPQTGSERLIWGQGSPSTLRAVSTTIRGVRVNLAAAICWENYMPLLRQALYAQNINLYLAPTADNRDAWMSLMRTVAVEGRCFVVSSNMCQRKEEDADGGRASREHNAAVNGVEADAPAVLGRRRNSTITAEGNEIALPSAPPPPPSTTTTGRRRMSVFDSDGNEIVLSCPDDSQPAVNGDPSTSSTAGAPAAAATTTNTGGEAKVAGSAPGWLSRGGSSIVSPFGDVLVGPQWEDAEGLLWADVDLRDCIKGRLDLDAAGSYSRNDSFKLSVAGLDLDPLPY